MATTFVFSPIPRFYQLAAKTRLSAFAHLHDFVIREESMLSANDRLSSQLEDQSTRTATEPTSSPFQPTFSDLFSSWIPSTGSQRLYTASLCCSGDEVIETGKYTRSVGPIAPPKGPFSSSQNPKAATGTDKFVARNTLIVPTPSPIVKDMKFANNSMDDCSNWLNLTSCKRPLISPSPTLNTETASKDRITPPPGSQSRLARILNAQNKEYGSAVPPRGFDDTSPRKI